jgi:hypothetical protein
MWWSLHHLTLKAHTFGFMVQHYYRNFEHAMHIMDISNDTKRPSSEVDDLQKLQKHMYMVLNIVLNLHFNFKLNHCCKLRLG